MDLSILCPECNLQIQITLENWRLRFFSINKQRGEILRVIILLNIKHFHQQPEHRSPKTRRHTFFFPQSKSISTKSVAKDHEIQVTMFDFLPEGRGLASRHPFQLYDYFILLDLRQSTFLVILKILLLNNELLF